MIAAMDKAGLIAGLEQVKTWAWQLPITGPIAARLEERLKSGEVPLWTSLAPSWSGRSFRSNQEAFLLLMNGLHWEVLRRADKPLGRFFPTCRGTPGDLNAALDQELDHPSKELVERLALYSRPYYEEFWGNLWLEPAAYFFQRLGSRLANRVLVAAELTDQGARIGSFPREPGGGGQP